MPEQGSMVISNTPPTTITFKLGLNREQIKTAKGGTSFRLHVTKQLEAKCTTRSHDQCFL